MTTALAEAKSMTDDATAGLRILVVDDNDDCAESTAMVLRLYGHRADVAASGPTALEMAQAGDPDVVLLDLGLPGMSGYDVARQLTACRPRKTPLVIALTGYGTENDRQRSAEAGIDLHLVKPVHPDELQAVLVRFQRAISGYS